MTLDKYEEPTKQILSSENLLQTIRPNIINQNVLVESQKFISPILSTLTFEKAKDFESTEDTDIRVKKFNELEERLKAFKKNFKKQSKRTDKQCNLHEIVSQTQLSERLNSFLEITPATIDIDSIIKSDEAVIQQHESNLEKIKKLMLLTDACKIDEEILPSAEVVNNASILLREVNSDIDSLTESEGMYSGLSTDAPNTYEVEIKQVTDNLYIQ